MRISSWWQFDASLRRELVDGIVDQCRDWRVAVIYGATSPEDRLYMSRKPMDSWSVHDVIAGLGELSIHAEWVDPTEHDFVSRIQEFDAAFINAHGEFGEDGHLQGLLACLGVPYTGSGLATSAVSADKWLTKLLGSSHQVPVPPCRRVRLPCKDVVRPVVAPLMAKASKGGSSVGLERVTDAAELSEALDGMAVYGFEDAIIEPFLPGVPVTVPLVTIGEHAVILPPIQCVTNGLYYGMDAKLAGDEDGSVEYVPMLDLDDPDLVSLHDATARIVRALDIVGAARADYILPDIGEPVLLELNTVPGVQHGSNLVLSAAAAGIGHAELLAIVLGSALDRRKIPAWSR